MSELLACAFITSPVILLICNCFFKTGGCFLHGAQLQAGSKFCDPCLRRKWSVTFNPTTSSPHFFVTYFLEE